MSPAPPKYPNLTRAGQGRPKKDYVERRVNLPTELDTRLSEALKISKTPRSTLIADLLAIALQKESKYTLEEWRKILSSQQYQDF